MKQKKQRADKLSLKLGIFKEELKNRFLCLVEIDGEDTLCYIPSSCRLSNFLNLSQKVVLLSPNVSPASRTQYSVFAVYEGDDIILLNTSYANKIIMSNIRKRRFCELGQRSIIKKEYTIEGYKCDLYIEDTKTIIEIKSLISTEKDTLFPSVYSERAIDQLIKLCDLLDKGYRVCYIFVSLNPNVKQLTLNSNDAEYKEKFYHCIKKGMIVKSVSVAFNDGEPVINKSIKINLF